jgi:periplasmic divalent cation tolerance protein
MSDLRIVLSNCSPAEAPALARTLVTERLAACVNVLASVTSHYRWEGELHADEESTLLIKTTASRYPQLEARLRELHSYDLPEIIALTPTDALADYAAWVDEETS